MEYKKVKDLKVGDMMDLQGDIYADPDRENRFFESEYIEVIAIEEEGPNCICIYTELDAYGFPPDHKIPVQ